MSDPRSMSTGTLVFGIVLVLSLVANTFFIGLLVGGKLTSERWASGLRDRLGVEQGFGPGRHGMPPDLDPRALTRMLPDSAQAGARELMEARGPEIRELFLNAMQARGAALDAMRTEPFDRDALAQALSASREADQAARAAVHALTVDIIAGMTPEEREQIGMDLHERFPGHHERHDWHDRQRHWDRMHEEPPTPGGD